MPALAWAALLLALAPVGVTAEPAYPDEAAVLGELNHARAAPATYAGELRQAAASYRGRYYRGADGAPHASIEGPAAVAAAADALAGQPPLPMLLPDPVLRAAAREHVEAQGREGGFGHAGLAGDTPGERIRRHGGDIYVAEVIAYGLDTAVDVVRQLVVDDGVAGRGHRRLLLSAAYRYAGVWCGWHATRATMCVVDLAMTPGGRPHIPGE